MKKWIITLSGERPVAEVREQLKAAGFSIEHVFDQIGSVSGFAAEDVARSLQSIPGVADVSSDSDVNIGPPEKPIT